MFVCFTCLSVCPQLNYADMLKRVDPLRSELKDLEGRAETTRIKGEEMNKIIFELEESISKYKEEYAVLISEANAIKADLSTVEAKVYMCFLSLFSFSEKYWLLCILGTDSSIDWSLFFISATEFKFCFLLKVQPF